MKKLSKTSLDSMAKMLPELDEMDQRSILGGTSTGAYPEGYTGSVAVPITGYTDADPYGVTGEYMTSTFPPTGEYSTGAVTTGGYYTWEEMNRMIDDGSWTGGLVEGMGYVGISTVITGSIAEDSTVWDDICDFCSNMLPDALTVHVSFDFAFLGGGGYDAGYAIALKGKDAGHIYSYDTYNSTWGAHAEASINFGLGYYTGNDKDMDFEEVFGGTGYSAEGDWFQGISVSWSGKDKNEKRIIFFGIGTGASAGIAVNAGHSNVKEIK